MLLICGPCDATQASYIACSSSSSDTILAGAGMIGSYIPSSGNCLKYSFISAALSIQPFFRAISKADSSTYLYWLR